MWAPHAVEGEGTTTVGHHLAGATRLGVLDGDAGLLG